MAMPAFANVPKTKATTPVVTFKIEGKPERELATTEP
jgi:hypothetical protein